MSTYSDRVAADEGALHAERDALGRLQDLAAEYAGTEVGAIYQRQLEEARAEIARGQEAQRGHWWYTPEVIEAEERD